jgi:hypothetical protein
MNVSFIVQCLNLIIIVIALAVSISWKNRRGKGFLIASLALQVAAMLMYLAMRFLFRMEIPAEVVIDGGYLLGILSAVFMLVFVIAAQADGAEGPIELTEVRRDSLTRR